MKLPIVQAVPNYSEGRDGKKIEDILNALKVPGVKILDVHSDQEHNRTVITLVGSIRAVEEALFRSVKKAIEIIDLNYHTGVHPRIGAVDVVPLVPLKDTDVEETVSSARRLARNIYKELGVPAYFYGYASYENRQLPDIRNIGFEKLRRKVEEDPSFKPDVGDKLHPTAGAVAIGVRDFLVAFNVLLDTNDLQVGKLIARRLRERTGFLKGLRVLAFYMSNLDKVQISMNIYDTKVLSLKFLMNNLREVCERYGTRILKGELVGLMPDEYLEFSVSDLAYLDESIKEFALYHRLFKQTVDLDMLVGAIASKLPKAGGGLAGGIALYLALALIRKVAILSKDIHVDIAYIDKIMERSKELANEDMESFEKLMHAQKSGTNVEEALRSCLDVSLEFGKLCLEAMEICDVLVEKGNRNLITDVGIAMELLKASISSARYNLLINVKSSDGDYNEILKEFRSMEERFIFMYELFSSKISLNL